MHICRISNAVIQLRTPVFHASCTGSPEVLVFHIIPIAKRPTKAKASSPVSRANAPVSIYKRPRLLYIQVEVP